jgi:hypothetical protein
LLGNVPFRKLQLRDRYPMGFPEKLELFEYWVTKLEFGNQK